MDNNKNIDAVKLTVKKGTKASKGKGNNSKKGKKGKKKKEQLNKTNNLKSDKKEEKKNNNEKIKIIEQKEKDKKEDKVNKKINIKKINVVNSVNNELNMKIKEKEEKIKELVLSQEKNKKILMELLQKVSTTIESNAEVLYSEQKDNKTNDDEEINKLVKLNQLLEKKKNESNKVKEINKKFKNKYENIIKDINTPSVEKFDILQKRINALKENNLILSQEIKTIKHKNNLDKIFCLNPKHKVADIKIYSDEYLSLTNEKFRHFCKLKNTKKLIKDAILQFQSLIKTINEKNSMIKNPDLDKEMINLKEDLSGDEESIYNRIINNKTIININDNNTSKKLRNSDSAKQIDFITSRAKKLHLKSKNMIKSKSSLNMTNFTKNDMNLNDYDCDNIDYKTISNFDFEKILIKKQKYLNFAEKLDKSINDTSIFYENKIKEINNLLEMNSKKLSNVQQENELLKSEIADMRRILELNKKENKIKSRNNFDKNYEKAIKKLEMCKNENTSEKEVNTSKNIEKDSYIEMIKKKYKPKNKSKLLLIQKEVIPNNRSYY